MKKFILLFVLLVGLYFAATKKDIILQSVQKYILRRNDTVTLEEKNAYYRDYDFDYIQITDDFSPNSKQDILNIYYTAINAGKDSFTFYCPSEYQTCLEEVKELANDQSLLSYINNFVHPYNSFKHIETEYDNLGRVTLKVDKNYTEEDIEIINQKIDTLLPELIQVGASVEDNIRRIHDYIINHSIYDSNRSDHQIINYKSDIAYGPLIEGYGLCGGYTDAMELFLEKLGVKSYKVSSSNHVWNAIYLNQSWYHIDLTWDDPVTSTQENVLDHSFFLITTQQLLQLEKKEHTFDQSVYQEVKEA